MPGMAGATLDSTGGLPERPPIPTADVGRGPAALARGQRRGLVKTAHRPWPVPSGPWIMAQTWLDLLFAHWRVPVEELRRVVPPALTIDTFDGTGWIGVVPFVIAGARLPYTPPVPRLSTFPELNVRTYVTVGGRPGVYFFSLDATSAPAVFATRRTYHLPYFRAAMSVRRRGEEVIYASERRSRDGRPAGFRARYRPHGATYSADGSPLESFLTERYCLYALDGRSRVHRAEIHHPPWALRAAEADFEVNAMVRPIGIDLPGTPLLHFAERQDALIWPLRRLEAPPRPPAAE